MILTRHFKFNLLKHLEAMPMSSETFNTFIALGETSHIIQSQAHFTVSLDYDFSHFFFLSIYFCGVFSYTSSGLMILQLFVMVFGSVFLLICSQITCVFHSLPEVHS